MSASNPVGALRWLSRSSNGLLTALEHSSQSSGRQASRSMATETQIPTVSPLEAFAGAHLGSVAPDANDIPTPTWNMQPVLATLYDFPTMEPLRLIKYGRQQLLLPLRRDILHRAVVYEGDKTRQGTASTKWRDDVHGSGRKIRPQKGTGKARLGDKKSPMLRGGGVAFGPHPRDFSTKLPRKIYDLAWRTALSYRYRRGQLIIVDDNISIPSGSSPYFLQEIFETHRWGREHGRSLLITEIKRERLFKAVAEVGQHGRILDRADVDVKDILETGRLIIEKKALDRMLSSHSKDLKSRPAKG